MSVLTTDRPAELPEPNKEQREAAHSFVCRFFGWDHGELGRWCGHLRDVNYGTHSPECTQMYALLAAREKPLRDALARAGNDFDSIGWTLDEVASKRCRDFANRAAERVRVPLQPPEDKLPQRDE